uniref:Putative eukaryotic translation initiation factor 4 gamma 1 n=1 Tax=Panstrongylus lignarius TaxID=156445 RepID=A0A224XA46_9HEMI
MVPPKKFISMRLKESFVETRSAKGISLRELLDILSKHYEKNSNHSEREGKKNLACPYQNLPDDERIALDHLKKLTAALNKLTPDNFYIQLLEIQDLVPANNYQLMKTFACLIVDKAVNEELYSILYARICHALQNIELTEVEEETVHDFGTLVLDECYGKFCYARSDIPWFSHEGRNEKERLELSTTEDRKRKLLVGIVRFLGDLFKTGMLDIRGIFQYIKKLEQNVNERSTGSLCKLLGRVGEELEAAIFQSELETDWCFTWERIASLSQRESLSLKQKALLLNLLNLRNNGWVSKFSTPLPRTSAEILLEEKEEADDVPTAERSQKLMNEIAIANDVISKEPTVIETEKQLLNLLKTNEDAHARIMQWELGNFKGRKTWLIYSLTRAVLRVSVEGNTINRITFSNHISLLKRYIISRQAEVACIYAVQYIVVNEMNNPKGLLEQMCDILHANDIVSYIAFLDWRENWSKNPVLEVKGRAEAHITLANFFMKLFWGSIKPSAKYTSIVKELNSFDLEHFVSMSKLPPEIGKRIKMEEEREKALLKKNIEDQNYCSNNILPLKTL